MKLHPLAFRLPWWLIGIVALIGIVGFSVLIKSETVQSTEISSIRSPDGASEAVLVEVSQDARGAHSAKVCLRRPAAKMYGLSACTSIAYLSGVPAADGQLGIHLEWKSSTELAIRYREAVAVYLYYPVFTWPGRRASQRYPRSFAPIHTRLIHTSVTGRFSVSPAQGQMAFAAPERPDRPKAAYR